MTAEKILHLLRKRVSVVRSRLSANESVTSTDMEHARFLDYQAAAWRDELDFLNYLIWEMEGGKP